MNTEVKKGTLFVKEVLARLTGNTDEALASKIARKSISALQGQVASLKGKQVTAEIDLEEARETLQNKIYPTEVFTHAEHYTASIASAKNLLGKKETDLEDINASLAYFEELLATVQQETV